MRGALTKKLLDAVANYGDPISAGDVYDLVSGETGTTVESVRRTLDKLAERTLLNRFRLNGATVYARTKKRAPRSSATSERPKHCAPVIRIKSNGLSVELKLPSQGDLFVDLTSMAASAGEEVAS